MYIVEEKLSEPAVPEKWKYRRTQRTSQKNPRTERSVRFENERLFTKAAVIRQSVLTIRQVQWRRVVVGWPQLPAGRVKKDERYLRVLQNKSTAAAPKQQQAVVVESSELLNHIQYIPAKAIKIPTTRQMSFPEIMYFPFFISIMQNYEKIATYPKYIYRSMKEE